MTLRLRRISALTVAAFTWATIFGSPRAYAGPSSTPSAAVVGFRTSTRLLERQVRTYLSRELIKSRRFQLKADEETDRFVEKLYRSESEEAKTYLADARKDFDQGKVFYESLTIDDAIVYFNRAVDGYRKGIGALRKNKYLLLSHLYLGMALFIRERVQEGRKYIREMIILDPNRQKTTLSKRNFPPKIVNLHKELTKEVLAGPKGTVQIRTEPTGVDIYFDGVRQPSAPYEIRNVPVGEHFILFEKRGHVQESRVIDVKKGVNVVKVSLKEWKPFSPYSFDAAQDIAANEVLVETGKKLQSKILILGELVPKRDKKNMYLIGQLYDTDTKEFTKMVFVEGPMGKAKNISKELAKQLLNELTIDGFVVNRTRGGEPLPDVGEFDGRRIDQAGSGSEWYTKWWFWTIIGVVAVGAGGYFAAKKLGSEPNFNRVTIPNPFN